jgi:DNA primase
MEKEGVNYHDALVHLAKKYGIKIEEREQTDEERQQQSQREGMLVVNEWAMQRMEHNLTETDEGRNVGLQYLYQRGITAEAIKKFRLGVYGEGEDGVTIAEFS